VSEQCKRDESGRSPSSVRGKRVEGVRTVQEGGEWTSLTWTFDPTHGSIPLGPNSLLSPSETQVPGSVLSEMASLHY
jgi:hypothetical protein